MPQPHTPAKFASHCHAALWVLGAVLALVSGAAQATCSRVITTPLAALGLSVIMDGEAIHGIYPGILRTTQSKETCMFAMTAVPRARQELLFESGRADILLPASQTPRRDALGVFVPLTYSRAALISVNSKRAPITTLKELLDARDLKLALVRGYDYGPAYQGLITELTRQGRLQMESDPMNIARLLQSGVIQATVMAPTILAGTLVEDERLRGLAEKLRYESLEELPWLGNGVYLSKTALSEADHQALLEFFSQIAKSGAVWEGFQQFYEPSVLKVGLKPR